MADHKCSFLSVSLLILFTLRALGRVFYFVAPRLTHSKGIMPIPMRRQTIKHKKSIKKELNDVKTGLKLSHF